MGTWGHLVAMEMEDSGQPKTHKVVVDSLGGVAGGGGQG
jgi:hypothetical protein